MCRLFLSQDPATYAAETRPIRLHGHATSIRLEAGFWAILEEVAHKERTTVSRFCATLHDEMTGRHGAITNFASVLRVTCLHYLRHHKLHSAELATAEEREFAA